jgi:predicted ATPase
VTVSLKALRLFGITVPDSGQELRAATDAELSEVSAYLSGKRIADIAELPPVTAPTIGTLIGLMAETLSAANIASPQSLPLLTAKAVNLSLRHGNTEEAGFVYSS